MHNWEALIYSWWLYGSPGEQSVASHPVIKWKYRAAGL